MSCKPSAHAVPTSFFILLLLECIHVLSAHVHVHVRGLFVRVVCFQAYILCPTRDMSSVFSLLVQRQAANHTPSGTPTEVYNSTENYPHGVQMFGIFLFFWIGSMVQFCSVRPRWIRGPADRNRICDQNHICQQNRVHQLKIICQQNCIRQQNCIPWKNLIGWQNSKNKKGLQQA